MPEIERTRTVRLVLCSARGDVLGALPPFVAEEPWWPEVGPVVAGAQRRFGVRIVVLRLLATEPAGAVMGGAVTYLAELVEHPASELALEPVDPDVVGRDDPLRMPWARPGGVEATLAWADAELARLGRPRTGHVEQVKSWNLSSLLRLPTGGAAAWSKSVPPFMAHEGAILALVGATDPTLVPPLLASDPAMHTALLEEVPGEDLFEADGALLLEMVERLVELQAGFAGRVDELLAAGLPDWRAPAFARAAAGLVGRADVRAELDDEVLERLDELVADLPRRLDDLAACGIPETLIHGDFHPGNWRSGVGRPVLVDWGDSGVGHPLFDMPAFLTRIPDADVAAIHAAWLDAWRSRMPDADPARAADLLEPVAALRQALIYRTFLDNIEASERVYHRGDPADWLRTAVARGV
jgi:hypothetical protein